MANIAQQSSTLFRISLDRVDAIYAVLLDEMESNIQRMRLLGLSDAEIFARMETDLDGGLGMFSRYRGALEREMDALVGMTAQLTSLAPLQESEELTWTLDPTVERHCQTCLDNEGKKKSFEQWVEVGLPGFGNTDCGQYCRCTFEEVKQE